MQSGKLNKGLELCHAFFSYKSRVIFKAVLFIKIAFWLHKSVMKRQLTECNVWELFLCFWREKTEVKAEHVAATSTQQDETFSFASKLQCDSSLWRWKKSSGIMNNENPPRSLMDFVKGKVLEILRTVQLTCLLVFLWKCSNFKLKEIQNKSWLESQIWKMMKIH